MISGYVKGFFLLIRKAIISNESFQIEFGYNVVSANDFEVITEVTIAGTPRKGVLKWRLDVLDIPI